jgi:hypothetical protein
VVEEALNDSTGSAPQGDLWSGQASDDTPDRKERTPADRDPAQRRATEVVSGARRRFFPCNREDALLLLGGLCVSPWFPEPDVKLAIQPSGVALVGDGLRQAEEKLVCGGEASRFPLLVEVGEGACQAVPAILEIGDVLRLVFRSRENADAFRYRPVDEFDPECLDFAVEPDLFGLAGDARFGIRDLHDPSLITIGRAADRILAGLSGLIEVGNAHEPCREPIARFIEGPAADAPDQEPNLKDAISLLACGQSQTTAREVEVVLTAFANSNGGSPRSLIDALATGFESLVSQDPRAAEIESRWVHVARDVARSRVELNGDLLSDDKSILLRAALLAAFARDAQAVRAFLDAEKPAGLRVATVAAFLVGLKRGIVGESWKNKTGAGKLSSAIAEFLRRVPDMKAGGPVPIRAVQSDTGDAFVLALSVGGVKLAEWTTTRKRDPDPIEQAWLEDLVRHGYSLVGAGRALRSWQVRPPVSDRTLEVMHGEAGDSSRRFPVLRFYFSEGQKFRKDKEIAAAFEAGGRLWSPRTDVDKRLLLSCEVPSLPVNADLQLVMEALDVAIQLCVPAVKPVKKARKKTVKSA